MLNPNLPPETLINVSSADDYADDFDEEFEIEDDDDEEDSNDLNA